MGTDSEARLLWATSDETSGALVLTAAKDLGFGAQMCAPRDVLDLVRPARFDLVGIELGIEARDGIALIRQLHDRFPRLTIIAALPESNVSTLRAAFEAGASDIVSLPLSQLELQRGLLKFRQVWARDTATRGVAGSVITLYGARGGLGVTTLAVNLAVQVATLTSERVLLADLDLQRGDVTTYLRLNPLESIASLAASTSEIDEIFLHGTLTRHPSGISVLAAPQQIEEADTIGHDEVKLVLGLLRSQFRYTFIDTPRTITGSSVAAFEQSDRVLLVTDLSIPSVRSARRFLDLLERLGIAHDRVDLLVTEIVRGPVEMKDVVRSLGKEPLAVIPCDPTAASEATNAGVPLNGSRPVGLSLALKELAAKVAGVTPTRAKRGAFLRRIFSKEATPQ
jgi:pilus assembly protein CpaE